MAEEIKQGNNKFYVGEDENNLKQKSLTNKLITMKLKSITLVYLMN